MTHPQDRQHISLRIPTETLSQFDKLSRLSGSNRTHNLVFLMDQFIHRKLKHLKETKSLRALLHASPEYPLQNEPEDDLPEFPEPINDGWGRWR